MNIIIMIFITFNLEYHIMGNWVAGKICKNILCFFNFGKIWKLILIIMEIKAVLLEKLEQNLIKDFTMLLQMNGFQS